MPFPPFDSSAVASTLPQAAAKAKHKAKMAAEKAAEKAAKNAAKKAEKAIEKAENAKKLKEARVAQKEKALQDALAQAAKDAESYPKFTSSEYTALEYSEMAMVQLKKKGVYVAHYFVNEFWSVGQIVLAKPDYCWVRFFNDNSEVKSTPPPLTPHPHPLPPTPHPSSLVRVRVSCSDLRSRVGHLA